MSGGQGLLRRLRQRGGHAAHAIQFPPEQAHVNAHAVPEVTTAKRPTSDLRPLASRHEVERPLDYVNSERTTAKSVVADHVLRRNSLNGPIPRSR
jgi:hypothetical protein